MQTPALKTLKTADMLLPGECAVIEAIAESELCVKLLQMGCLPGKKITHVRSTFGGNPLYVRVANYFLALRKEEAAQIIVNSASGK